MEEGDSGDVIPAAIGGEEDHQIDSGLSMDNILDSPKEGSDTKESFISSVEKEAKDACVWLKAAGFPQYVQMYEEGLFPLNLSISQVERDHSFLDQAAINALFRRLNTLNKCADLMTEKISKDEDSDEEEQRALSENWRFQKKSGRWSRKFVPKDKSAAKDSCLRSPSPLHMVVGELRRSLGELRENSQVQSYEFSEEMFAGDSPPAHTEHVDGRIRSVSLSQEDILGLSKKQRQRGNSLVDPSDMSKSPMLRDLKKGSPSVPFWRKNSEDSSYHSRTASNPSMYMAESPASQKRASDGTFHASPLVQMSCRSHSIAYVNGNGHCSTSSLRSPSPVLVQGSFFSHLDSGSVDSILDDITEDVTKKISKLKNGCSLVIPSQHPTGLLEPPVSSEGFSSSLDLSDSLFGDNEAGVDEGLDRSRHLDSTVESVRDSLHQEEMMEGKKRLKKTDSSGESYKSSRIGTWHSFRKNNSYFQSIKPCRTHIPIDELSVGQITVIRKLCLLRLTALLELYNPNNKIGPSIGKLLNHKKKAPKMSQWKDGCVFGVPLITNVQNTGQPLPPVIMDMLDFIRKEGLDTEGLFRKAGNAARVMVLEETIDHNPKFDNFSKYGMNDLTAVIKSYLRRLPDPLVNSRVCDALIHIHEYVPSEMRLEAVQTLLILLPCECRLALQIFLLFLRDIVDNSHVNQMDADNLAVCMSQSLFSLPSASKAPQGGVRRSGSFRRHHEVKQDFTARKEISDSLIANKCLSMMIKEVDRLFVVSSDMLQVCKFSYLEVGVPVPYGELGQDKYGFGDYRSYIEGCVSALMKEHRHKFKNWTSFETTNGMDLSWQKVGDGLPLKLWKVTVDVPAPPHQVFKRLWNEQALWDSTLDQRRVVAEPDMHTQIYQFSTQPTPTHASRDYCILRSWRYIEAGGHFVIVCTSVTHPAADLLGSIRGTIMASRYLMEPLEGGCTRLTYFGRWDVRGVTAEYLNYGLGPHICSHVAAVKSSFKKSPSPDFLETSV
jgi:hypothetical protein